MSFFKTINDLMNQKEEPDWPWAIPTVSKAALPGVPFFTAGGAPMQPPQVYTSLIVPHTATEKVPYNDIEEIESEVLFEFEGWWIESWSDTPQNEADWLSHECPVYKWRYRIDQWQAMSDECCPQCCEAIPEEVLGVWKLKNFNHLPSKEESRAINYAPVLKSSNPKVQDEEDIWA